jgi:predicted metal-dependent HD superfamily phosphohydrolase
MPGTTRPGRDESSAAGTSARYGTLGSVRELSEEWRMAALGAGAADGPAVKGAGAELLRRWREPHRHYHSLAHLTAVLSIVDTEAAYAAQPDLVRLAAWCHDAVYDPRAAGDRNERDSAALAGTLLAGIGLAATATAEVGRLVLLTAGHQAEPADSNGSLLCDADLAILAAAPDRYDRYAEAIRREYRHLPEETFREGRAQVLRRLLALPALYRTPALAGRWEEPARANLSRELGTLSAPS